MKSIGLALHIPATGAAQLAGNALTGKGNGLRGLIKDIRFGEMLSEKLQNATNGLDAASQLAALLQGGIPVATVAKHIATSLTDGIARALGGMSTDMQQQLQRALANALAPPGSDQRAQALVQRLRSTIETLTGDGNDAGQQSRFSGDVLDAANTAREIPALQTKNTSLIDSIVADAIARLQTAGTPSVSTPANEPRQAVNDGSAAALTTAAPPAQTQTSDIIGRMIARALGAGAQRPVALQASVASAHGAATQHAGSVSSNVTPGVLFERLVALIEQNAASNNDGAKQNPGDDTPGSQAQFGQPLAAGKIVDGSSNAFGPAVTPLTFSNATAAAAAPAAGAHTPIDAQAVIDQIVKGFAVHTSGSTSEVRMRLQPEQLGDVSLKLSVSGGTVNASIVAQNADVRQTLLANQHHLAASLADAGLSLGNFSVDVSGGNPDGRTAQQFQQFGKKSFSRSFVDDVDATETTELTFGPSILNRPADPWLMNYFA